MTTQELIEAQREESRAINSAMFRALAKYMAPIVAKYRTGDFLAIPPVVTPCAPRIPCPVCGHGIGRAECKNWKGAHHD